MQPSEAGHWKGKISRYLTEEWAGRPSLFAEFAVGYFPAEGRLLELGSGSGQDSVFFATKGYDVTQTDVIDTAFSDTRQRVDAEGADLTQQVVDLWQPLSFSDGSFDIVYAQLSLHYFDAVQTVRIFEEIHRVMKPGGILAAMFNSTADPEYSQGVEIEPDYFLVGDIRKRYFSTETLEPYLDSFDITLLDNEGQTYKDLKKGVRHQIRLIARK